MKEIINGHILEYHGSGDGVIYIDHIKATTFGHGGIRSDKGMSFWRKFLKDNPNFDSHCLLPPPFINNRPTFEDMYT